MAELSAQARPIAELLGLRDNSRAAMAVIGSGGKTSLVWLLARRFRRERVLVSTSTKMKLPPAGSYDRFPDAAVLPAAERPDAGITFAGTRLEKENKVGSLPLEELEKLLPHFDKAFVEADGSRRLPYKGWAAHEPVLPRGLDLTVAVLPVPPAGLKATAANVHRLPLFLDISGARPGRELRAEHLAAAIAHPAGLLGKTYGRVLLFLNQADDAAGLAQAGQIAGLLPAGCKKRLWRIVAGSVRGDSGVLLHGDFTLKLP